ncbi:hypothetical protein P9D43_29190 [Neobacillus niacini]|uniref:hypothetical protein n=1 Tax=Neobacillus niacini TaxID=86668 RepID=UPI0007ABB559|nr:hypothetical protein [Neobacillus niacini]MEC1526071.1 hypothetical protein [Neobacillus niacini]
MEAAFFLGTVFDIEFKRKELEEQNLSRKEVKDTLEKEYRTFSKKSAFTCLCCNKPVNMNLTKDEGRPFYFKHIDGEECTYSENSKTYDKHIDKHEDKRKKDIGLTLFKEILEGQLKPLGIEIERGFLYKKKLSIIPDFILKFRNSNKIWAVDYFTSFAQGLTTGSYARHLRKRMETYKNEGFLPFSFIDSSWLAIDRATDRGTLLSAEKCVINKSEQDYNWDEFLSNQVPKEVLQHLKDDLGDSDLYIDVNSISYVDIDKRTCNIIRFLEFAQSERNISFYKICDSTIPLERALSYNPKQKQFQLFSETEQTLMLDFQNSLVAKWEKAQIEIQQREEQARLEAFEKARMAEELNKKRVQLETERKFINENYYREKSIGDQELTLEMEQIMKEAAQRPVDMSPEEWEWYRKTGRRFTNKSKYTPTQPAIAYESTEQRIQREKREKFKEKLLTHPISGENYLAGEREYWRLFILKWIKDHKQNDVLMVPMSKLLKDMKTAGISFNQIDKLVQYPVKSFITFYQQELKKDLKEKLILTYMD